MFWSPILSLLVMWCSGSDSQPVLSQPPSSSVSLGNTAKLSCVMGSGFSISGYNIYWYQQKPGNPPRYLLWYYSDSNKGQGSGVPSRFSASKDTSSNTCYLNIAGILAEDEADYHCATYHGSGSSLQYVFGGGTTLIVSGQPASPPTVNLFPPSAEERQSKNKATLVCLVNDFRPPGITVTWQADGSTISSGVETTKPIKHNDKYIASSYLTMESSEWEKHSDFTCKVTHEGTDYPKTISRSQCP